MIDTEAMRCKILENALKGQISDTLIADENVANLINLLRMQKEECIKKGLISKDKKALPITEKETPFQIPAAWSWVRIGDIFYHNTGKALNSSNTEGNTYEYITTSNVYWDRFELNELKTMLFTESEIEKCTVKKGDLLVCEGGDIGRAAIWDYDEEIKIQNHIHRLRPYVEICVRFYYYVFLYYKKIGRINGKGIGLQGLSTNALHELIVPLPPKGTQWKIVKKIDEVFEQLEIIDELQRNYIADIKALKNKLFDVAIQGKLSEQLPKDGMAEDLYAKIQAQKVKLMQEGKKKKEKALPEITEDEIPFDIPPNWKWVRLGDISGKISSGNTPAGGKKSNAYVEKGYSFFREQNIYNDGIHEEGLVYITEELLKTRENSTVMPMDILLNITGGSIGRCALVPDDFTKGSINQHILIIRMIDPRLRFYIHTCICSPFIQKYIKGNTVGDKDGFSAGRCKNMLIPLPPLEEQRRIVSKIKEVLTYL